jgi:hypothetical protein
MSTKQLLLGTLIIGVIANILDFPIHGVMLDATYKSIAGFTSNPSMIPWFIFGDFVAALVFTWYFGRVHSSFEKSTKGGMMYGLYTGILVSIPMNMVFGMMVKGFPYWLSWGWTVITIVELMIYGAILGMLVRPKTAKA